MKSDCRKLTVRIDCPFSVLHIRWWQRWHKAAQQLPLSCTIYLESSPSLCLYHSLYTRFTLNIVTVVTDVHDVTGLVHGPAAGADSSCIYLESFSFSLLYTIEYTHTVLPNFHIVTTVMKLYSE
jgi:hypothetical protein